MNRPSVPPNRPPKKPTRKTPTSNGPLPIDQQVRSQLHALSQALEETSRQYVLRLQREITDLTELAPLNQGKKKLSPKLVKSLQAIAEKFSSLQIRPGKGRRKDLKRIDELIGEVENILQGQ